VKRRRRQNRRILGIALSARGFGYALFDGKILADWSAKTFYRDKNNRCMRHIEQLIEHYAPDILVVENHSAKGSRRCDRIRQLGDQLVALSKSRSLRTVQYSRQKLLQMFLPHGTGSRHDFAVHIAGQFSEELATHLPPKRRLWHSEDYRMAIFDAVALAITVSFPAKEV
jgi:hypothetical protein